MCLAPVTMHIFVYYEGSVIKHTGRIDKYKKNEKNGFHLKIIGHVDLIFYAQILGAHLQILQFYNQTCDQRRDRQFDYIDSLAFGQKGQGCTQYTRPVLTAICIGNPTLHLVRLDNPTFISNTVSPLIVALGA